MQRSKVIAIGKSHIDVVSALVTYTNEFFGGRVNALEIQMYGSPLDAAARARLIKNHRADSDLSRSGAAYFVFFVDKQDRITQVNLTYVIPGTTVVRTIAYTQRDIDKWFSDYRYAEGRLHLTTKGTYVSGTESPDDQLTLGWDLDVDEPVLDQVGKK